MEADTRTAGESGTGTITFFQPGAFIPEPNLPPVQGPDPNLGPGNPDYAQTLPRVAPAKPNVIDLGVESAILLINGTDYSDCFLSASYSLFLDDRSTGTVELRQVKNFDLDPETNLDLRRRNRIVLRTTSGGATLTQFDAYIVERASFQPGQKRVGGVLQLVVGDIFRRLDGEALTLQAPDCELAPSFAGPWCERYLQKRAPDRRDTFPRGAKLIEPSYAVVGEDAYTAIAKRMNASGLQVGTDANGAIVSRLRPQFNPASAIAITDADLVSTPRKRAQGFLPYSKVNGQSNGTQIFNPQKRVIRDRIFPAGYDETDFRPFFLGGLYYFEDRTRSLLGDYLTSERREKYAIVPLAGSTPSTGTDGTAAPCLLENGGSTTWDESNTQFKLINTFNFDVQSATHPSGRRRVFRKETRNEGEDWINDGTNWVRFPASGDALINERIETSKSRPLPNQYVCARDYIWSVYQHQIIERKVLRSTDTEITTVKQFSEYWYLEERESINIEGVVGSGNRWLREEVNEFLDTSNEAKFAWVTEPKTAEPDKPPNAEWIPLGSRQIKLDVARSNNAIAAAFGASEPAEPISMPFVYERPNAERFLDNWLRQRAGLYDAIEVDCSWTLGLDVGTSCTYEGKNYIVVAISKGFANKAATVSALLSREY